MKKPTILDLFGGGSIAPKEALLPFTSEAAPIEKTVLEVDKIEKREEDSPVNITYIPTTSLVPFSWDGSNTTRQVIFRPYCEEKMKQLASSIKDIGILSPLQVRPSEDGRYSILAGHNRHQAALNNKLEKVPCIIQNVDEDTAKLIYVSSNLEQRDDLFPSEKAFAYKLKKETSEKLGFSLEYSFDEGKADGHSHGENEDSLATIYRYIRLTELTENLLVKVDDGIIVVGAGEYVSYLSQQEQELVYSYFFEENNGKLDKNTAKAIKEYSLIKELNYMALDKLVKKREKPTLPTSYSVSYKKVAEYLPKGIKKKEAENLIVDALRFYHENYKGADANGQEQS